MRDILESCGGETISLTLYSLHVIYNVETPDTSLGETQSEEERLSFDASPSVFMIRDANFFELRGWEDWFGRVES